MATKRLQLVAQGRRRTSKAPGEPRDLALPTLDERLRALFGPDRTPFLTLAEAAPYLRYTSKRAATVCQQFLQRAGVRLYRRGRCLLVLKADVHALLETGQSDLDRTAQRLAGNEVSHG